MTVDYEFQSLILTTWDNELGKALTSGGRDGWEMVGDPKFLRMGRASGWNEYAIGLQPHFLVIFRRSLTQAKDQATS